MNYTRYTNVSAFMYENCDFLYQSEIANNLLIGIVKKLETHDKLREDILICSIKNSNETLLVAIMTMPNDLVISTNEKRISAIDLFIDNLMFDKISVPGVLAQNEVANYFCMKWQQINHKDAVLFRKERIHHLLKCNHIKESKGYFKEAEEKDIDLVSEWIMNFNKEVSEEMSQERIRNMTKYKIKNKEIFFWIDNVIVSMCATVRETLNGKSIGLVYTPFQNRQKGYATSCVSSLCRRILKEGKSHCSLFTDLSNMTSNGIYKKIGFEPVVDLLHYKFS